MLTSYVCVMLAGCAPGRGLQVKDFIARIEKRAVQKRKEMAEASARGEDVDVSQKPRLLALQLSIHSRVSAKLVGTLESMSGDLSDVTSRTGQDMSRKWSGAYACVWVADRGMRRRRRRRRFLPSSA